MSCPFKITDPEVALSRVAIILSSVVFPAPDSPIMEMNSPLSTEKFTPFRASVVTFLVLYVFFTSFNSKIAISLVTPFFFML